MSELTTEQKAALVAELDAEIADNQSCAALLRSRADEVDAHIASLQARRAELAA